MQQQQKTMRNALPYNADHINSSEKPRRPPSIIHYKNFRQKQQRSSPPYFFQQSPTTHTINSTTIAIIQKSTKTEKHPNKALILHPSHCPTATHRCRRFY